MKRMKELEHEIVDIAAPAPFPSFFFWIQKFDGILPSLI